MKPGQRFLIALDVCAIGIGTVVGVTVAYLVSITWLYRKAFPK